MNLLPKHLIFDQHYFGLSISQNSVRAISINSDKTIKSQAEVQLPPNVLDHGVLQKEPLTLALKQIVSQGNFSTNFTAVTIPDIYSFSRLYTLPKISLPEVTEAITWQIEKIFPLPKDQIYFDWKLISTEEGQLTVLIVALHKRLLDDLISIFEIVGVKPISFEPAASALARVITTPSKDPYILIESSLTGTSTTLIDNQLSTLTVTHKFETAVDNNQLLQKITQSTNELVHYYVSKHTTPPQNLQVFITGEIINPQLINWLNNYLTIKIKLLEIPGVSTAFHQAFAAASTSVLPPPSEQSINLLPEKLQEVFDASLEKKKVISAVSLGLVLLGIALAITVSTFIFALINIQKASNQIQALDNITSQSALDTKRAAAVNNASAALVRLFPLKNSPVNYLSELTSLVPSDVIINNFSYTKDKKVLIVTGHADSRTSLLAFKDSLNASKLFTNINVPLESLEKPFNVDFSITLTLVPEAVPTPQPK